MIIEKITNDDEFFDPNINYEVLMSKIKSRIIILEEDLKNVKDPEMKGIISNKILELRESYFDYLKVDFELQHVMRSNPNIYNVGRGDEDETV